MDKKYQVFISSTYDDLKQEREQVIKAVLEMGHIPVGMEMFSAGDEEQWKLIARQIEQTDYYVLIVGHRYGSETEDGISYTEKEYDYASSLSVPTLGFVISENASWPSRWIDKSDSKLKKLESFKAKVKSKLVHFWDSKDDLHGKVSISLMKTMNLNPRTGWVRASNVPSSEATQELVRLSAENSELRKKLDSLDTSKQPDEEKKLIHILDDNVRRFKVRTKATKGKWSDAVQYKNTLLELFLFTAPSLVNESTTKNIAKEIAFEHVGNDWYRTWPIGDNKTKGIVADFVALDLVEPSRKKHSVNDKEEYWSLTKIGKSLLKRARRLQLEEGLETREDKSEETN